MRAFTGPDFDLPGKTQRKASSPLERSDEVARPERDPSDRAIARFLTRSELISKRNAEVELIISLSDVHEEKNRLEKKVIFNDHI